MVNREENLHRRRGAGAVRGHEASPCAGLDGNLVLDVLQGRGPVLADGDRGATMVKDEFEFGLDWMRKDPAICMAEGNRHQPTAGDGPGGPSSTRRSRPWAAGVGTSSLMRLLTRP